MSPESAKLILEILEAVNPNGQPFVMIPLIRAAEFGLALEELKKAAESAP